MPCNVRTRTMFKCLVVVYISTILVIMSKIQMEQPVNNQSALLQKIRELHQDSELRHINTSHVVYRNITKVIYVNKTNVQYQYTKRILEIYGPGENGTEVLLDKTLLSPETVNITAKRRKKHGFDTILSDIVSLHRKLPDLRPQECKDIAYPDNLPQISVVIIFRDEWPSIILRTAYSVLENSPPELLKEIVLVDDGSLNEDLRIQVDVHVKSVAKFKLVRHKESLGLMLARQRGIEATTADYFATMDGHMEVSPGWLEPLLFRLVQEPNALLCSHVGAINPDNFGFFMDFPKIEDKIFDNEFPFFDPLTLDQQWVHYKASFRVARNHSSAPLEYGTIQGMMAVMKKAFFMQLGGFDPGMKIWGAEQIELSVKVWMCGGRIEMIPCSKVMHMYRITPWGAVKNQSDYYAANKRRMIEVWMDEPYKGIIMDSIANLTYQYGDLTDRHRIRAENKCKPYAAFIAKVMEFADVFQPVDVRQRGVVYNPMTNQCLDLMALNETDKWSLGAFPCHGRMNQYFLLTKQSQIRSFVGLLVNVAVGNFTHIEITKAVSNIYDQYSYWSFNQDATISHKETHQCLTVMQDRSVQLYNCTGLPYQTWKWGPFNKERMGAIEG